MTQFSQLEYLLTLRKAQPNFLQHHSFFCQRRWVIYFQTMCILQRERIHHLTRMLYDDMLLIIKSPPPSLVLTNYYYTYYSILCKSDILSALLLILTPGNHAVVIYQESKCKTTLIFFAPYLLEYVLMYKYRIHLLILLCKMWLVPLPNISNNDGRDIRVKNWEEKWIIEGSKYPLGLIWFGQLLLLPVIHWVWSKKKRILIFVHQINFIPFFMSEKFGLFLAYSILAANLKYPPLTSQPNVWSINRLRIKQLPLFIDQTSGWEVSGGYVKSVANMLHTIKRPSFPTRKRG